MNLTMNTTFIVSGQLAKVFTWDTGTSLGDVSGHSKRILSCSFKPSRPIRLMTSGEDAKVIFHTGPPFKFDHSVATHTNYVNAIRYSPNGTLVVTVSSDKKIQLYDGVTGHATVDVPNAHNGSIYGVTWSPDSTRLLTVSADKTAKLWDLNLNCLRTFTYSPNPQLGDVQVSSLWTPDVLLTVSLNGNINYLDVESSSEPLKQLQGHQVAITCLTYDPDTKTVFFFPLYFINSFVMMAVSR